MKRLIFPLLCFFAFSVTTFAQTSVSGTISVSTTWSDDTMLVVGDITINDGVTLTINPGLLIEFQGHYSINVKGRLLAVGTEMDSIKFTINDTTGFYDHATDNGAWNGIVFNNAPATNDTSRIQYCIIEYSKTSSEPGGALRVFFEKLQVSNCLIRNNKAYYGGGGIYLFIYVTNSNVKIINNTICNNYGGTSGGGIYIRYTHNPVINNNVIINNYAEGGGENFNTRQTN